MRKAFFLLGIVAALVCAQATFAQSVCDAVSGNLVQNCGFETGTFSNWTVNYSSDGGSNLYISTNAAYLHSGTHGAVFAAAGPQSDTISEILATTVGKSYTFSFWLEDRLTAPGQSAFTAYWDGTQVLNASTTAFGYTQFTFTETGTGSDTIKFSGYQNPSSYALDDVAVVAQASTPEPGSILLLGTIILAVAAAFRRLQA